jgi:hypothetical protein
MTASRTQARNSVVFANGGTPGTARRRQLVGTLVLLVAIPALAATASAAEVVATLVLDPAQLEFGQHEGYDLVSIEGAVHTTIPTEPMLPALHVRLLLPPGSDCTNIQTSVSGTVRIPGTYDILPAPRPVRLLKEQVTEPPQPRIDIYGSDSPYPRSVARLAGVGTVGGYRVATIIVTPVQYIPATGELRLHTHIEISAATEQSDGTGRWPTAASRPAAFEAVSALVSNGDELPECAAPRLAGGSRETSPAYLIICPAAFRDAFESLAEWKMRKGVTSGIATVEDILADASYEGADPAERIRACISSYAESGTEWVLLGGDTNVVPSRVAHDCFYDDGLPCDLYYADLDGTWDGDGDGVFGETDDGVDMYSDVFVGRAPVENEAEAATFVSRVLAYEGATFSVPADFERDMLLLGEIMWDDPDPYTDGGVALDMIEDASVPPRFCPVTKLYERDGTLSASSVISAIEEGAGLIVHQGHSNIGRLSVGPDDITSVDLDALGNGDSGGLWYSVGCWSAAIDQDAFAEHWLTNPAGGGVAYVGNARYGWGCPGYPGECVSDLYSQAFFASLFEKDLAHAGLVHADAKHTFVGDAVSDDYMRYAMYELNLLGDPETEIWTDTPALLSVSHDSEVHIADGMAGIDVTVTSEGNPIQGATVCLSSIDFSVYAVEITDAVGTAEFDVAVDEPCELMVTVTARNCVPSGSFVDVLADASGVVEGAQAPATVLRQNSPNPFASSTTIHFALGSDGPIEISIYDVSGRRVRTLLHRGVQAGSSFVHWDGRNGTGQELPSGTYFVRMEVGKSLFEKKMTLMR